MAVELEPQTFLLLQFLIENRDRVVSKDEIFEVVWEGRIVADSTLAFAVNAVRRAVDDDGKAQAVIRTFPRRGFRFVAPVVEAQVEEVIDEAGTDDPLTPRRKALSSSDEPPDGTAATRPGAARRWRLPAIAVDGRRGFGAPAWAQKAGDDAHQGGDQRGALQARWLSCAHCA